LKNLNKGKAGGPSQITYEILQQCSGQFKEIIRKFYNFILKTTLIPNSWSKATIYPIPKPGDWNFNLNKT